MPTASLRAILTSFIFGGVAILVMGWSSGGMAALLIFMACVCATDG